MKDFSFFYRFLLGVFLFRYFFEVKVFFFRFKQGDKAKIEISENKIVISKIDNVSE